jgi:hypothetical protein
MRFTKVFFFFLIFSVSILPQLNNFLLKTSAGELQFSVFGETIDPFAQYNADNSLQRLDKLSEPIVSDKEFPYNNATANFRIFQTSVLGLVSLKFYYLNKTDFYLVNLKFKDSVSFSNIQSFLGTLFEEVPIKKADPSLSYRKAKYKIGFGGEKSLVDISALIDARPGKREVFLGVMPNPEVYYNNPEFNYPKIEVDPNAISQQKLFDYYNMMASELYEVVVLAQGYYAKPKTQGGGENSFLGFVIPNEVKETENCVFAIDQVTKDEIILSATSKMSIMGQDGKNPLKIQFVTTPQDMQPRAVN